MSLEDDLKQRRQSLRTRRAGLSSAQQALFAKRLQGNTNQATTLIPRRQRAGLVSLSLNQQRLWFLYLWEPVSSAYNISTAVHLAGNLDRLVLVRCLNEVIRRHEILRTTFAADKGQACQIIHDSLQIHIPVVDLRRTHKEGNYTIAHQAINQVGRRPFDLSQLPLIRFVVFRLTDDVQVLLLVLHHIIADGWSVGVFLQEMMDLYFAYAAGLPSPLPPLPIQYADFAVWQRQQLEEGKLQPQLAYWQKQLAQIPTLIALPTDHLRPPVQTFSGRSYSFQLPRHLADQIKSLGRQYATTPFMTLEAAFAVLLFRYTRQEKVVVGTPSANRNSAGVEDLIGFFVNTLALCHSMAGNPTFAEFLAQTKAIVLEAQDNQDVPFEMLVQTLQVDRDPSHNPIFQVMFLAGGGAQKEVEYHGLRPLPWQMENDIALFDLLLGLDLHDDGPIDGVLTYNTDLFAEDSMAGMAHHFQTLLESMVADPQQQILDVPLSTAAENKTLFAPGAAVAAAHRLLNPRQLLTVSGRPVDAQQLERVLVACQGVNEAAVTTYPPPETPGSNMDDGRSPYLVAYLVLNPGTVTETVQDYLKTRLPAYMMPSLQPMTMLPRLSDNGIDFAALPPPQDHTLSRIGGQKQQLVETEISIQRTDIEERQAQLSDIKQALLMKKLRGTRVKR